MAYEVRLEALGRGGVEAVGVALGAVGPDQDSTAGADGQ